MEIYDNYSDKSKMILDQAFTEVKSMNMNYVGSEHLLLSLLKVKSLIIDQVKRYNQLTYKDVKKECLRYVGIGLVAREIQGYSRRATEILKQASYEANSLKSLKVEPVHILLALLDQADATAVKVIEKIGFSAFDLKTDIIRELDSIQKKALKKKKEQIEASLLTKFGVDMTKLADDNKLEVLVGRKEEVARVIQILGRKTKNNPCLIGEPGVGKTAIVEGIARAIKDKDVPDYMLDKKLVAVNLAALLAGSKFRGEFEDRLTQLINEVKYKKDIILFIDEIHTLIGAGATNGPMDASNILKPFLGRDDIQLIGATTITEYRRHIEKDAALERRLQPVFVQEPSEESCIEMLMGLKASYETYHQLTIEDEAIFKAVKLSSQYIADRFLPDKAIDVIDEAASRCKLNGRNELTNLDVKEIITMWTGIPIEQMGHHSDILNLTKTLSKRVVGQSLAVDMVSKAILRSRVGLNDGNKPLASFVFLGTSGVGKTELAKSLANTLFGNEKDIIRVDMSEFMERHSVSKLIGSPPGYMAYEEGGQLTEKIRSKPFSVVLFDELEKAHPDVLNMLLQVLDEGQLTDGQGRTVSFRQSIIIFTSNIGIEKIKKQHIGFGLHASERDDYLALEEQLKDELKKAVRPEFINRIDDVVVFRQLEKEDVMVIISQLVERLKSRLFDMGYDFSYDQQVLDLVFDTGYSQEFGVRSIKRTITRLLENPIAEHLMIIGDSDKKTLYACLKDGHVKIE